jgi:thiamine kinase-like enzyme
MGQNLKALFYKITGVKVRSIEELTLGFSNLNYKVNDSYVLRLPPFYRDPSLNYSDEKDVYDKIAPLNISEKITYFNITTGIKISRYVHNTRPYSNYPNRIEMAQMVKILKKLHTSRIKLKNSYNYLEKLNIYKQDLPPYFLLDSKIEEEIVKKITKRYSIDSQVICHNDLVQNNMLFKYNGVVLIDWEYASMNPLYFDLASFISENNLNEEDEIFFLSKYFGYQYTKAKKNIVEIYMSALDLLFYYWAQHMFIKKGDSIYITIAAEKLNRIKTTF